LPIAPSQMHLEVIKNEQLSFTITAPNTFDGKSIFLDLSNGTFSKTIQPNVTQNQNDYVLQHIFEKPGNYDVHINVDDTIIATYVVKVKRK